tara:strand:+ start:1350 stop:1952 length:603 start_codon:yes stop_codon:yes gene_type:complete
MLTLGDLSKPKKLENNVCYETDLGLSLNQRTNLLKIIRGDNSWSNKQQGLFFTNLYAHHTQWHMHDQFDEFKELTDLVDNYLASSVLQVPFNYKTKECWGGIYGKDDYAKVHHHEPYLWAWCYYPFAPEGTSPLRFHKVVSDGKGKFGAVFPDFEHEVYPHDDLLVLFSGYRRHSVPKSTTERERVVIAGNIYLSGVSKF